MLLPIRVGVVASKGVGMTGVAMLWHWQRQRWRIALQMRQDRRENLGRRHWAVSFRSLGEKGATYCRR